jgi:hypothetical protein
LIRAAIAPKNVELEISNQILNVDAVPEPSTWAVGDDVLGFAGIGLITYRRKSKPSIDGRLIHDHQVRIEEPPSGGFFACKEC